MTDLTQTLFPYHSEDPLKWLPHWLTLSLIPPIW